MATTTTTTTTRLLWRGAIVTSTGHRLYGVAIIAHLFSVPSASSCSSVSTSPDPRRHHHATPPSSFSPFEDPFASTAKASSSGADMCLGLEMLRGRDLLELVDDHDCGGGGFSVQHVQPTTVHCRDVSVLPGPVEQEEAQGENAWRSTTTTSVDRKGKGKQRESPTLTTTTTRRTVKVETPTDVRVYIDERCTDTVEWFEDRFCRRGGTDRGIELDAGGEKIIVFARPRPRSVPSSPTMETASTSSTPPPPPPMTQGGLPVLDLLLGRPFKPVVRKPRPDDPLPRENLFAAKLRKTASLPAAAFNSKISTLSDKARPDATAAVVGVRQAKIPKLEPRLTGGATATTGGTLVRENNPKKRLSSKEKSIASLLSGSSSAAGGGGGETDLVAPRTRPVVPQRRQHSVPPGGIAFPFPPPPSHKRPLSRSFSTSASSSSSNRLFTSSSRGPGTTTSNLTRQGSVPPTTTTTTLAGEGGRPFRRSRSSIPNLSVDRHAMLETVDRGERVGGTGRGGGTGSRSPSPTPSFASMTTTTSCATGPGLVFDRDDDHAMREEQPGNDEDDDDEEEQDRLEELREIGIGLERQRSDSTGGRRGGIKRSLSVPVESAETKTTRYRSGGSSSFLHGDGVPLIKIEGTTVDDGRPFGTTEQGGRRVVVTDSNAIEARNKNTVKKLTMNRLDKVGIGRDHVEFKEIFSMVTRGVGFALRSTFKTRILSNRDRDRSEQLIERHLELYMPPSPMTRPDPLLPSRAFDPLERQLSDEARRRDGQGGRGDARDDPSLLNVAAQSPLSSSSLSGGVLDDSRGDVMTGGAAKEGGSRVGRAQRDEDDAVDHDNNSSEDTVVGDRIDDDDRGGNKDDKARVEFDDFLTS